MAEVVVVDTLVTHLVQVAVEQVDIVLLMQVILLEIVHQQKVNYL